MTLNCLIIFASMFSVVAIQPIQRTSQFNSNIQANSQIATIEKEPVKATDIVAVSNIQNIDIKCGDVFQQNFMYLHFTDTKPCDISHINKQQNAIYSFSSLNGYEYLSKYSCLNCSISSYDNIMMTAFNDLKFLPYNSLSYISNNSSISPYCLLPYIYDNSSILQFQKASLYKNDFASYQAFNYSNMFNCDCLQFSKLNQADYLIVDCYDEATYSRYFYKQQLATQIKLQKQEYNSRFDISIGEWGTGIDHYQFLGKAFDKRGYNSDKLYSAMLELIMSNIEYREKYKKPILKK